MLYLNVSTLCDLLTIFAESVCICVANALHLPALQNPSILQRRQQIIGYLGASMEAQEKDFPSPPLGDGTVPMDD